MELEYNGHSYSKRFARHFVAVMCEDGRCDPAGVDWRRSSRRTLRVRDFRVYHRLLRCSERYAWPRKTPFWCRPRRAPARRPRQDDAAIEDYARAYGYDREDGEVSPEQQPDSSCEIK